MFSHITITWPALWNAPVFIYYHNCWHECNFDHFYSKHGANWKSDLKRSLSSLSSVSPQLLSPPSAVPCPVCCGVKCKADWAQMPPVRQTQQSNSGCVWGAKANISTRTVFQSCWSWDFQVVLGTWPQWGPGNMSSAFQLSGLLQVEHIFWLWCVCYINWLHL